MGQSKRFIEHTPFACLPLPLPLQMQCQVGVMAHYPAGHRWSVDNMWTHASADELLPHYRRIVETMPGGSSHMVWLNWHPKETGRQRPEMAYSVEDRTYISLYGNWKKASDDAQYGSWAVSHMKEMEHLASGCQLADENLLQRTARFVTGDRLQRLDEIRARRDPLGRFHAWGSRPASRL